MINNKIGLEDGIYSINVNVHGKLDFVKVNKKTGYWVSLSNQEIKKGACFTNVRITPKVKMLMVARYYFGKSKNLFGHKTYLGVWTNPETKKVYIDISIWVKDLDYALQIGKQNKQISVWDNAKGESIKCY